MPQTELVQLDWPLKGLVENAALMKQPEMTTTDCLNVRNYDVLDRRNRGGQRTGLSKYITGAVNNTNPIQVIGRVVLAFDSTTLAASSTLVSQDYTDAVAFPANPLPTNDSDWDPYTGLFASVATGNDVVENTGSQLQTNTAGANRQAAHYTPSLNPGAKYIIRWRGKSDAVNIEHRVFLRVHPTDPRGNEFVTIRIQGNGSTTLTAIVQTFTPPVTTATLTIDTGSTNIASLAIGAASDYQDYELQVNGNLLTLLVNNSQAWTITTAHASSQSHFGVQCGDSGAANSSFENWSVLSAATPVSLRTVKLVVASGGNIYTGSRGGGLTIPAGGTTAFATSGRVGFQDAFQQGFFADGLNTGYNQLNLKTNIAVKWQTLVTDGALPTGGTGVGNAITAVDTSAGTFTVAEDLSALTAGDFVEVRDSGTDNDQTYTVTSTSGTGPTTITVDQTIQSSTVSGDLFTSTAGCRIIVLYRGRIVMAGLETDPQNWFMSKSGNPFDWDYFPAITSATQAVAGNSNQAGRVGDVITALAPYLDDLMIIGGANTIWIMRGDPAAGGNIDNISRKVGIVGPEAWTFDTGQNFYFFGVNGLYRMDVGGGEQPVLLSQNRLDKAFTAINTAEKNIRLVYDPEWQGVHIFITNETQPATADRHYFWDERNDAFWPDEYPIVHGPTAVFQFSADNPEDNAVLCGGFDSFVRSFDESAVDDDGTVISSRCRFTPIVKGNAVATTRLDDVTIITDRSGGTVTYKHFAGDTVEQAEANADDNLPVVRKDLPAGRATPIRQRVSQNAHMIELSQSGNNSVGATWAYESGILKAAIQDRIRGRRV